MAIKKLATLEPDPWERLGFPMLTRLGREFDAMFGRFGLERPLAEHPMPVWSPQLEMSSSPGEFTVKVDMPGMKKEDVILEMTDDHLVLRGERKQEKEEKKDGFVRTERTYGSFYRTVPLPEGVKAELAKAVLRDGVLEITMPMTAVEAKTRTLEIAEPTPEKGSRAA